MDKPGDECTSEGADGVDSCIKGAKCTDYDKDGVGTCLAMCAGSFEAPVCDVMSVCLAHDGLEQFCIPTCNPLQQDCGPTETCYAISGYFFCGPEAPGEVGEANDACEPYNSCDKGLLCGSAAFVGLGCEAIRCCTPVCELPDGTCPNPDQQCLPLFGPMDLPPNDPLFEIGACGVQAR